MYEMRFFWREIVGDTRFNSEIAITDYLFFVYEVMANVKCVVQMKNPFYHYRYISGGLSKGSSMQRHIKCLVSMELIS